MAKLLSSLNIGDKVKLGKHQVNNEARQDIVWQIGAKDHAGYPANSVTLVADKIIDLRGFDAKEPGNSDSSRGRYGNNRYKNSNLRQWLNKSGKGWFSKTHNADEPPTDAGMSQPTAYDGREGFLSAFTADELNAILDTTLTVAKNTVTDGGGSETLVDKVFLLSNTEVGLSNENNIVEGSKLPLFSDNNSRRRGLTQQAFSNTKSGRKPSSVGDMWYWLLRTPYASSSNGVRNVPTDGTLISSHAYLGHPGVLPALNLKSGIFVSDSVDSDGAYTIIHNNSPTISGADTNLGDKNTGFSITYSVNDTDLTDTLTVKEKINGITIRTLNNAPRNKQFTIEITEEMLYNFNLLATNTIEIEVNDGQGQVVYRRYTFKRTNTAPKISGQDENLGEKTEGFDITFSATDQENDTMSAKIYINDKLVQTYEVIESSQEYTYTLSKLEFVQLGNEDEHKIRIEVQDHNNATAIRNYTFTRKVGRIMYAFEKETDIMATQILISPTWYIAEGAEGKVLVCNNAYDEEPTWEDATEQILLERHFNFTNAIKTGDDWGIGVQIIINKGTATELSYLAGFGGAFK